MSARKTASDGGCHLRLCQQSEEGVGNQSETAAETFTSSVANEPKRVKRKRETCLAKNSSSSKRWPKKKDTIEYRVLPSFSFCYGGTLKRNWTMFFCFWYRPIWSGLLGLSISMELDFPLTIDRLPSFTEFFSYGHSNLIELWNNFNRT